MMIPARRVYLALLIGTGIGLAIAAVDRNPANPGLPGVSNLALLVTLVWDGLVLALAIVDSQRANGQRVTVSRQPLQRLSIGRDNPVRLTVQSGKHPVTLQIRDDYPAEFRATPEQLRLVLPANSQDDLTYTVFPTKRGEYRWGEIYMRQLAPWGLAWNTWKVSQGQTVEVYPDLAGLRSLSLRLTLQTTGNIRRAARLGMGTEFAELREYGTGDDPRLIDWKATARRNRLLLRVLEPEQEQTLIILLDRGRLMTAQVNGLTRFDWGLNATLALALTALHRGDRVGIGVFDHQMQLWIPPERRQAHLSTLLERLTPIQPVLLEPDYLGAVTTLTQQQTRRALVVLITDVIDQTASAELLSALGRLLPRYLPFCVTLRDPQIDRQADTATDTVTRAYQRAVALDLLTQRQVALAKLKQKGGLVLDAPADRISHELVDRYLQLKARNQL
jgi:uncharacterized protein (DUF58 family)